MKSIYDGTLLGLTSTDLHPLINNAISDVKLFEQNECRINHRSQNLLCTYPCFYCGSNAVIFDCHPYCVNCRIFNCNGCDQSRKDLEYMIQGYRISHYAHAMTDSEIIMTIVMRFNNLNKCLLCFRDTIDGCLICGSDKTALLEIKHDTAYGPRMVNVCESCCRGCKTGEFHCMISKFN